MTTSPATDRAPSYGSSAKEPSAADARFLGLGSLGLGCYIAWSFLCWNSSMLHGGAANPLPPGLPFEIQGVFTALSAFGLMAGASRLAPLRRKTALLVVFALFMSATVALSLIADFAEAAWLVLVAFALSGVGSTLRLGWEELFSTRGAAITALGAGLSYGAGFLIFLIASLLPREGTLAVAVALPFAALVLLALLSRSGATQNDTSDEQGSAGTSDESTAQSAPHTPSGNSALALDGANASSAVARPKLFAGHKIHPSLKKLMGVIALVFFGYGLMRTSGVFGSMQSSFLPAPLAAGVPAIASLSGIVLAFVFFRKNIMLAFYLAFPLMAVASLLPADIDPLGGGTAFCTVLVGSELIKYLIWFIIIDSVATSGPSLLLYLAFMRFAQWGGSTLGQLSAPFLTGAQTVAIAVLLTLLFALLLIVGLPLNRAGQGAPTGSAGRSLEERAAALAQRCGLSPRESEVLAIWVTGRTSAYIERTLFISKSTVKTHLNHIYAKTGTANREELLELLEDS